MKSWIKGGLIAEALLFVAFLIMIPISQGWVIFMIPFFFALAIPSFFIGAFLSSLFSKRVEKSSEYHKKWMIWSMVAIILILGSWFLFRYLDTRELVTETDINNNVLGVYPRGGEVFTLNNMSPLLYLTLFASIGIFIIATILYIVTKIKSPTITSN